MLSIVIFALNVCIFGAVVLYLHYRSEDYGLTPLLFFVAGIMAALNFIELISLYVEVAPGIVLRPGGHVYVPLVLLTVLILYISSGTRTARIVILGLSGINVLILSVLMFLLLYLNIHDTTTTIEGLFSEQNILTPLFLRGVLASVITFSLNMVVIIIVYQGIKNGLHSVPDSVIPGIALIIALWVDAILYNILAFFGTSMFVPGIPGDVIMKTLAGLLLVVPAGWYLTHLAPKLTRFQGAADRPTFAILFAEDIAFSRLHKLESELQVSRAIYEQIMLHIEEVFWLVDIEKERIVYLSPTFEKLTGKPAELFYKNPTAILELIHPDDRTATGIDQLFLTPESEFRIQRPDGSIRWMRHRSFAISTPDQQIVRYAGITEDITAQRDARTQAFALEISHERVNLLQRFIGDASHDLRTPLASILLKLELMKMATPTRQRELIDDLHNVAEHLNQLIDDLFTLSRVESDGQIPLSPLDLTEIVQQCYNEHIAVAQAKNLQLSLNLPRERSRISGNREQLFRLVGNLVSNAINYTEHGSVTLRLLTEGSIVVLEVTDTGIGIPQERINTVFERFFRTDEARTIRPDGTGLGLAIARAIVEQHHGAISVQSSVGIGTTFQVSFPAETTNSAQPNPEQNSR